MNQDISEYKFLAKLGSLKTVVHLLKALNFKETATCHVTENGLKVTVEDSKCMQAHAYIPAAVFEGFILKEDVMFSMNLTVLVECLYMFWNSINTSENSVTMELFYKGSGHPVNVLIEENGIITDCSLKTQDTHELLDFTVEPGDILNTVILQAELLKDIMLELDQTCELIELLLSPEPPYFRISTDGLSGICHIELPHDGDFIENFKCTSVSVTSYRFIHIKSAMKALSFATKVSLRTTHYGLLCFQYMVKTEDGHICFVEYYISPVIGMDSE